MQKIYSIKNLDCAHCASNLETALNKIGNINASIDFLSQKLYIDYKNKNDVDKIFSQIISTSKDLEPKVVISIIKDDEEHTHTHSHEHEHHHHHSHNKKYILIFRLILTFVFMLLAKFLNIGSYSIIFYLTAYFIIGYDVLLNALKNIAKGKVFDENFLMSLATVGAFLISDYTEAVAVMIFYQIGEYFQDYAVDKSRKSIKSLMDIKPEYANILIGEKIEQVSPSKVKIGDTIIVKTGERVPLDGIVIKGNSFIDSVALTGESVPRSVKQNDEILSGVINTGEVLQIKVTKLYQDSTVYKILKLVESASSKKARVEKFITKFSKYYTPVVVISALILAFIPPLLFPALNFKQCITNALTFLVISCPCALVISVPLSFFAGIGGISKMGVLVKESRYLEILSQVGTVVFDKTGTLTKGVFEVFKIENTNIDKKDFISYCAYAEYYSNHPIAKSIKEYYNGEYIISKISNYKDVAGYGVTLNVDDEFVLFGNDKLMDMYDIKYDAINNTQGTICHLAVNNEYKGYLIISDKIKDDSKKAISCLKEMNIETIMLTGDNKNISQYVANNLGINSVYSELLPTDKASRLEKIIKSSNKKVAFVGDGINDAPVLTLADVGISMGGVGSDSAIEASDIVIMTDEPSKIIKAIRHSKYTLSIVKQNIVFALSIKILFLILGAFGLMPILLAVFADVGVSMIAILNSIRALYLKKDNI